MAHYAHITDGIVDNVIVIDFETLQTGLWGDLSEWVQTSYNTHGGNHAQGGTALRKNYAGIGFTYDSVRDAFIPPKVFASYVLDEETCLWVPPVPKPTDGDYVWNEEQLAWIKVGE
jgi:hypothetical protein